MPESDDSSGMQIAVGDVLTTRSLSVTIANLDAGITGRIGFTAPKGKDFVVMLLGTQTASTHLKSEDERFSEKQLEELLNSFGYFKKEEQKDVK